MLTVSPERLIRCHQIARETLLAERDPAGYWVGELSTSPLSTATAVVALELVRRQQAAPSDQLGDLVQAGLQFLAKHQNADGGWGDTLKSFSNISTTMLAHAAFHATNTTEQYTSVVERAQAYIDRAGGIPALKARYGKDRTFSVPILTHCASAGVVDWCQVAALPFELACLPQSFYKRVRLPVVSYALPALIAIGQVNFHHRRPWNPVTRLLRHYSRSKSLEVLERIQPTSGGFLEATPLTAFVTMSLAGMGLADHPVAQRGVEFLINSVRPDGSWPIDTNLATWVTTLSVNSLGTDLPEESSKPILDWLLNQQYQDIHPYTGAAPGGWAWTDLPGGVPDADDTSGALLALQNLAGDHPDQDVMDAATNGIKWLLDLQNSGGGWPTFCRGWGYLPFDRSSPDLTAHALRALSNCVSSCSCSLRPSSRESLLFSPAGTPQKFLLSPPPGTPRHSVFSPPHGTPRGRVRVGGLQTVAGRIAPAITKALNYLEESQRPDGSWLPLWFGNQHSPDDENPTYGTTRVLAAYRDLNLHDTPAAKQGYKWLTKTQNPDGGWGGGHGGPSSIEETALAIDILFSAPSEPQAVRSGLNWLLDRVEDGTFANPSPIGFYFAKLWYFERLYPIIFTVAALRRACETLGTASASLTHAEPVLG